MEKKIITPDTKIRFNTLLLTKDGIKFVVPEAMAELDTDTYLPTGIGCRSGDFLRHFYELIQEDIQKLPNDLRPLLQPLLPVFKVISEVMKHKFAGATTFDDMLNSGIFEDGFRKLGIFGREYYMLYELECMYNSCCEMCNSVFNAGLQDNNYNINMHFTGFENDLWEGGLNRLNKCFHLLHHFCNTMIDRFPINFITSNKTPYEDIPGADKVPLSKFMTSDGSHEEWDVRQAFESLKRRITFYRTLLDNGSVIMEERIRHSIYGEEIKEWEMTPGIMHKDGNEFAIGRSIMRMIGKLRMPDNYFSNLSEAERSCLTDCFNDPDFWEVGSDSHNTFVETMRQIIVRFKNINSETCDAIIGEAKARVCRLKFELSEDVELEDIFGYIVAGVNENLGLNYIDFFENPDNATRPIPHETREDMKYFEPMYLYQAAITMVLLHFRNHDYVVRNQIVDNILRLNEELANPDFEPPELADGSITNWVIRSISQYKIEYSETRGRRWSRETINHVELKTLDENEIIKLSTGAQQIFEAILGNNHPSDITFHNFREGDKFLDPQRIGKEHIPHIVYVKSGNAAAYLVSNSLIEAKYRFLSKERLVQVCGFNMNAIKTALLQIEGKYRDFSLAHNNNNRKVVEQKIAEYQDITKEMTESGSFMISENELRRNLPAKEQVEAVFNEINTKYPSISLERNGFAKDLLSCRFANKDMLQKFLNNIDAQVLINEDRFDEDSISFVEMLKAFTVEQFVEFEGITVRNGETDETFKMFEILYEKYRGYFDNERQEIIADEERIWELCSIHFMLLDDVALMSMREQFATKLAPWQIRSIRKVLKYHEKDKPEIQELRRQMVNLTAEEINSWTAEQLQPFKRFYVSLAEITNENCSQLKPMHLKLLSEEERGYINDNFGSRLTVAQNNAIRIFAGEIIPQAPTQNEQQTTTQIEQQAPTQIEQQAPTQIEQQVPTQIERPNRFFLIGFWIKYWVMKLLHFMKIISTDPEPLCPTNLFRPSQQPISDTTNTEPAIPNVGQERDERTSVTDSTPENTHAYTASGRNDIGNR